ncbi:MAG: glycosyltransferase family 4 protein [Candidatus Kapabacteria bacterium]|nr:glycosyltransferase family 4 protein [Candidatus Kapabacteria bacterium]
MSVNNVLVFAYYFPPMGLSGVQRVAKFMKYLPDYGWRPHVIATGPTAYYAHDTELLDELAERDIVIHRTSGTDPNSRLAAKGTVRMPHEFIRKTLSRMSSALFIPDNKRGWASQALRTARELVKETSFDCIWVSGPPFSSMMAAARLSVETGIPLVVDYRDLWYGNQFSFYPTPLHAHLHKQYEYDVLTHASKVVVTNRRIKERLLATYPQLDVHDVVIIPHGYDSADFDAASQRAPIISDRSTMSLTYAGIFYEMVTPKYFLEAMRRIRRDRPDARISLHFAGLLRDQHKRRINRYGLQDITTDHGYLSHPDTVRLLMDSDVLWMMVGHGRNADTISSGKLYEYIGSRKPLLVSVPQGALRRDAERYGAATLTDPTDVQAIVSAINGLYDKWQASALPQPDQAVVEQFDRRTLTGELAKVLATSIRIH